MLVPPVADIAFLARGLSSQVAERSQPGENSLSVHFSCENKALAHNEMFSAIMTMIVIVTVMMMYYMQAMSLKVREQSEPWQF